MPFNVKEMLTSKNVFFFVILLFVLYISFYKNKENATNINNTDLSGSPNTNNTVIEKFNKDKMEYIKRIKDKNIKKAVVSIQDEIKKIFI